MKAKLFFSIVILLQLILISCNEKLDETNVTSNNKGNKLLSYSTNPYDSIGIIHNEIMAYAVGLIEERVDTINFPYYNYGTNEFKEFSAKVLYDAADSADYLCPEATTEDYEEIYDEMNLNTWFSSLTNSTDQTMDDLFDIANNILLKKATIKDRYYTLNLLIDIKDTYDNYTGEEFFNIALTKIINHETLILAENWNENEKAALVTVAVAKHSCEFWANYFYPENKQKNSDIILTMSGNAEAGIIMFSDVVGGTVTGITTAAALGKATCGLGTVFGWMWGRAVGAAGASGAAALAIHLGRLLKFW